MAYLLPTLGKCIEKILKGTAKKKLMDIHLASAILKLIESDCSVLDIIIDSGYYLAAHFTTTLKMRWA
ncbi:hypothetical protein M5G07_05495 [Serratia symbiotica]|nr:hypothetical protein [Serratia symbiotica]